MKSHKVTFDTSSPHGRWYGDACGTAFGLELLGERWSLLIVRELMFGPRRFTDIRAHLPGISAKVLTERLAGLEASDVVQRIAVPEPTPAQLYGLTEWGYATEPIMQALGRWASASPLHDPTLPLSPISFMLSLRTMLALVRDHAGGTRRSRIARPAFRGSLRAAHGRAVLWRRCSGLGRCACRG